MFESLSDRLQSVTHKIKGYGKITESNIEEITREIRLALLEADVNYKVVKEFTSSVKERALGTEVSTSLKPSEVFVKILNDELVKLLGEENAPLTVNNKLTVIMLVGLQGSGKTTTCAKIASLVRKKYNKKPLLVACDIYRPAAIDQLKELGKSLDIPVYEEGTNNPSVTSSNAVNYAKDNNLDYVIIDTAGRLHIDDELTAELKSIENTVKLDEIILVIDAMTGQDAVNVIEGFNNSLNLTGAILTKMDGDTKGGAALSIRHLTNLPIKFIGTSEKINGLNEFHPERMASRILGMGDLISMVEHASEVIDEEEAMNASKRMQSGKFDLEDFLSSMKQIKKLGPLENLIKMIPGASKMGLTNVNIDPKDLAHIEAIILSMTPKERKNPSIIKASRKRRIANGSGRSVEEVNRLLKQFEQMKQMMKMMKGGKLPF